MLLDRSVINPDVVNRYKQVMGFCYWWFLWTKITSFCMLWIGLLCFEFVIPIFLCGLDSVNVGCDEWEYHLCPKPYPSRSKCMFRLLFSFLNTVFVLELYWSDADIGFFCLFVVIVRYWCLIPWMEEPACITLHTTAIQTAFKPFFPLHIPPLLQILGWSFFTLSLYVALSDDWSLSLHKMALAGDLRDLWT